MKTNDRLTLINLSIYRLYFFVCYLLAIAFSAICFNLMLTFFSKAKILETCAACFMTIVFYLAGDAADILEEIFSEKIAIFKLSKKNELS